MSENGRIVAIKISKNSHSDTENAQIEAKILNKISNCDPDSNCLVQIYDSFYFRRHFLIVTEMMDLDMYNYMKKRSFDSMAIDLLKRVAQQTLVGLKHLTTLRLIHCDLKPENILFTDQQFRNVKIIDFGSACTEFKNGFTYVQSRFYRSPEVALGIPYSHPIDMWSFGCIIAEMLTGKPLFSATDEKELIEIIRFRIGLPPEHMLKQAVKRHQFFDQGGHLIRSPKSRVPAGAPERSRTIRMEIENCKVNDDELVDFLEKCLAIDPDERLTPE